MLRPALVGGWKVWRSSWEAAESAKFASSWEGQLQAEREARLKVEAEVERLTAELVAMGGDAEAERGRRVEAMGQKAMRRMFQSGLARGWEAWVALYEEKMHQRRMLAGAAQRMMRPALVGCWNVWHSEWEAAERDKIKNTWKGKAAEAERQVDLVEAEARRLRDELKRERKAVEELKTKLKEREEALGMTDQFEREKRVMEAAAESDAPDEEPRPVARLRPLA